MQSDSVSSPSGEALLYDIVVAHVGSAGPRAAGAIAAGLDLPVEAVIGTIYRAPAVIAAGLGAPVAERLVAELGELGLSVYAAPAGTPIQRGPLLDVAAEIVDPGQADAAAAVLADFLGTTPAAALDMLLTPPGLILGQASAATVEALAARLPAGAVALATVDPASTRYTLFAASLDAPDRAAVAALAPTVVTDPDGGLVATGLSRGEADRLWRRLAGREGVRLVPEAFLRFDLHLVAGDGDPSALEQLAGIPAADVPQLLPLLPVTVEERRSQAEAEARMADYAAAGFTVTAHLATFATATLEVAAAPPAALSLIGAVSDAALPLRLPPLSAPRARVLRARLEAVGAEVWEAAA